MVKKENFDSSGPGEIKVKTETCDLRVKSEFKSDSNQQSRHGGGSLKFYKGKLLTNCTVGTGSVGAARNVR